MRIAMPRGDIKWQRFMVNAPNGMSTDVDFTSIYFTVKKNPRDRTFMFQKSLKRGEIYRLGLGDYQFKIDAKDTMRMVPGDYTFDIQLGYKNLLKETFVGDFVLKPEITYPENEDEEEEEAEVSLPQQSERTALVLEVPDYHVLELATPFNFTESLNYNNLTNKPTIEGVTLEGDLMLKDFGLDALTTEELEEITEEGTDMGDNKYLDSTGIKYLWEKAVGLFVKKDGDKVLSDNNFSDEDKAKLDQLATDAINAVTMADLDTLRAELNKVYHYRGSVPTYDDLTSVSDPADGDVYDVQENGMNYAWDLDSARWDALGSLIQVESLTNEDLDSIFATLETPENLDDTPET